MYVGGMLSFDDFEGAGHLIFSWVLSNSHLTTKRKREYTVHIDLNISIDISCVKTILLSRFLRPHAGRGN